MRGSIWHILNAIYISLHKTSIDEYKKIINLLKEEIKRFLRLSTQTKKLKRVSKKSWENLNIIEKIQKE